MLSSTRSLVKCHTLCSKAKAICSHRTVSRSVSSQVNSFNDSTTTTSSTSWLAAGVAAVAASTALWEANESKNKSGCSGILGFTGGYGDSRDYILKGLDVLKHRGFDGVGIATIDDRQGIVISKKAIESSKQSTKTSSDPVLELVNRHYSDHPSSNNTSMAHTRWATHVSDSDLSRDQ